MKNSLKNNYFLLTLSLLSVLSIFFIGFVFVYNVDAQTLDQSQAIEVEQIKQRASDIIYSEQKTLPVMDTKNPVVEVGIKEIVNYSYLGNEVDSNLTKFSDGQTYSNLVKVSDNIYKAYSEPKYFKNDNGQVQEIITKETTPEIWSATKLQTTAEKVLSLLKTPYAIAQVNYSSAYDGVVLRYAPSGESWYVIRNSGGTGAYPTNDSNGLFYITCGVSNGLWKYNTTAYYAFDLSSVGSGYHVSSSTFAVYGKQKIDNLQPSQNWAFNIYAHTPANVSNLITSDYPSLASTAFSDTDITFSNWNVSGYNFWQFNSFGNNYLDTTGVNYITLKESVYNVASTTPSCTNGEDSVQDIEGYMSEHIGTDYDPYLLIEVAEDEETPPVEFGTSTPVSVVCIPQTNNDLSLITGCSIKSNYSSSTGTTTEEMQYVFHIPAIVWIILFLIFDFIFGRILIEFLIILRQKYGSR